jgi:hypothetical protein
MTMASAATPAIGFRSAAASFDGQAGSRFADAQLRQCYASSTMWARKTPMPVISTSSLSPGFIHNGGLRP